MLLLKVFPIKESSNNDPSQRHDDSNAASDHVYNILTSDVALIDGVAPPDTVFATSIGGCDIAEGGTHPNFDQH